jgi:hypothetical protein
VTGPDDAPDRPALMKVTVNLIPRAVEALEAASARTKDSKTDTINRALQVYELVLDLEARSGGALTFMDPEGRPERIHLL